MAGNPRVASNRTPARATKALPQEQRRADGNPSPSALRRAVFFDRDGTLNEEVGYVNHPRRFQLFPFASQAVREVNQAGLLAIVVTSQSGVARGLFSESLLKKIHRQLAAQIVSSGGKLDDILYCPHHPQAPVAKYRVECACRKPSPGLLERAAAAHGINLAESFVIGDRYVDVRMAQRVGARGVLVLTGYGRGEWQYQRATWDRPPDHIAQNVYAAVRWILRQL